MWEQNTDVNSHRRFSIKYDYFLISHVLNRIKFNRKNMDYRFGLSCIQYKYRQETEAKELNKISDCQ